MEQPIPLPKFTFLLGAPGNGQNELAAELCRLDPSLGFFDLREPLRMAIHALCFGGFHGRELPLDTPLTTRFAKNLSVSSLLEDLEILLRSWANSALGQLAISQYQQEGEIYDHLLYRDVEKRADIEAFVEKFGGRECLTIHCGPIGANGIRQTKNIWLPSPDLSERIALLHRELEPRQCPSTDQSPTTNSENSQVSSENALNVTSAKLE